MLGELTQAIVGIVNALSSEDMAYGLLALSDDIARLACGML